VICLSVLVQYRRATDARTDGHTTTAYRASIASRGKKSYLIKEEDIKLNIQVHGKRYREKDASRKDRGRIVESTRYQNNNSIFKYADDLSLGVLRFLWKNFSMCSDGPTLTSFTLIFYIPKTKELVFLYDI